MPVSGPAAGDPVAVRLVRLPGGGVEGTVGAEHFEGWLGLLALLERHLACGEIGTSGPGVSPDDAPPPVL